jgi:hypothetical protein
LPLDEYEFTSPLLGFRKSAQGYSGWYAPARAGRWNLEMKLPAAERARLTQLEVNGSAQALPGSPEALIRFAGESEPGKPLRWAVR